LLYITIFFILNSDASSQRAHCYGKEDFRTAVVVEACSPGWPEIFNDKTINLKGNSTYLQNYNVELIRLNTISRSKSGGVGLNELSFF